jgi:fatty acid amide hydrolase 2
MLARSDGRRATTVNTAGILRASALQLAAAIGDGRLTSRRVVDAHIDRLQEVNPQLNALVMDRFARARAEADAADAAPAADRGPLHGVPCTIKEAFAVVGMPQTAGLMARHGRLADHDAVTVRRLRDAGAIVLGVTNTSELCMWMESNNRVYGRSRNPHDVRRIVGGSSGGEGAVIGAGGSPFGLGSDVGGSIRMPAYFNGIFGHKPSSWLVPNDGQFPAAENRAMAYLTTGPMSRRAEDLWPLLQILAEAALPDDPSSVDVSSLRVVVPTTGRRVHPDLEAAREAAAAVLAARGATVQRVALPALRRSFDIWSSMLTDAGGTSFAALLGEGEPIRTGREFRRWVAGRSPHTLPALFLAATETLPKLTPGRTRAFVREGLALRRQVEDLLGDDGVLLYPPYPVAAPRHGVPIALTFHWTMTAIFNVLEIPVTQVPLGTDRRGLPLGVQVGAAHGKDHLGIAVAQVLEAAGGGWIEPRSLTDDGRNGRSTTEATIGVGA